MAGVTAPNPTIAVTGATGTVGRFLCTFLQQQGCTVRGLIRQGSDREGFAQQPHWVEGTMQDPAALAQLADGAHALVHCALDHIPDRYRGGEGGDPAGFWQSNLIGSINVLEAAAAAGVDRTVLLSSRAVFGQGLGAVPPVEVDDDAALTPNTHYGALKAAMELVGRQYAASTPMCISSIRPTGVYGITWPLVRTKWLPYVQALANGDTVDEVRTATEVHGRDLSAAIWLLLNADREHVNGRSLNCSDLCLSTRDLVSALARIMNIDTRLPAAGPAPANQMLCNGLRELGWKPGGAARLKETLEELVRLA